MGRSKSDPGRPHFSIFFLARLFYKTFSLMPYFGIGRKYFYASTRSKSFLYKAVWKMENIAVI